MKKFMSMRNQTFNRYENFRKKVKGEFGNFLVQRVAVIKTGENEKADRGLKRGIIEVRRDLSNGKNKKKQRRKFNA